MKTLQGHFKPEFLNRVDDIIVFRPLGMEEIARIVELQLKRLEKLLGERKITIALSKDAKVLIAEEGDRKSVV